MGNKVAGNFFSVIATNKEALRIVSAALGHSRLDAVTRNHLEL